jgi:hypothetical protein
VAKYIDTSLDWADNNARWNSQTLRPDDEVLKESSVFSLDNSYPPFQASKDGSPHKNDEQHLREEDKRP